MDKKVVSKEGNFKEIPKMGVSQFRSIYKELNKFNIVEILNMASYFPRFVMKRQTKL